MKTVTIQINDLFEFAGQPLPAARPDNAAIEALARRQFDFLRQPLQIQIGESAVTISFNEESANAREEAERLAERAAKRAAEGNYGKAVTLWKRVLELNPAIHQARRDLAMVLMETGDTENAKNHLIEVLRLNPGEAWNWVVIGNLYAQNQHEWPTAEKFLRRALEISPNDAWALNGIAAITAQRGQTAEAVKLFEQAIAANPGLPNPYYGLGVTLQRDGKPDPAARALERLFAKAKFLDVRSKYVFDQARALYEKLQDDLVKQQHSEAFKAVENVRAKLEQQSGYPVRVTEGEFKDKTTATIQMAWKHGRDHHLIKCRVALPDDIRPHQMAHELMHLQLETEARKLGKNRFFITTTATEQSAMQRFEGDLQKLRRKGFDAEAAQGLHRSLVRGLANFLYNCPLDMLIERKLRKEMPVLSASQFLALRMGAQDALGTCTHPQIVEIAPKIILRATLALNGAYALFLDGLFHGATQYTPAYQRTESFGMSQRLFAHWQARCPQLGPGDEYALVDEFAEMLGLKGWYDWKPDPGAHTIAGSTPTEGTTNAELLRQKHMPAVYYLLSALKRYDQMPVEKIREIAFEIGMIGQNGLDYASPESQYVLKSLPEEQFTGLQLMCLMFAGFKRIAPEHDLGMDLHEPFLLALAMFQNSKTGQEG